MTYANIVILTALLLAQPVFAGNSDIAQRAQRIEELSKQWPRPDDVAYAEAMRHAYDTNFGQIDDAQHLRGENDAELKLHWDAVESAAFYSDAPNLLDAAIRVHTELQRRGLTEADAVPRLFNFMLKARRFAEARAFATAHPNTALPSLPEFIDAETDRPSVWRFNADNSKAQRVGIDLQPLQIIVAAGCHFSADAAEDIAKDPELGPVFAKHAHWLAAQPGDEKLDALAEWNHNHPQTPMLAIYDRSEWALIPQWMMPTFTIVKDGKLIDSVHGWGRGDPKSRQQLVALLQRAGLLAADAP